MPGSKDSYLAHVRDAAFHAGLVARSLSAAAARADTREAFEETEQLLEQARDFAKVLTRAVCEARSTPKRRARGL